MEVISLAWLEEKLKNQDKEIVLKVGASWCSKCRECETVLNGLEAKYPQAEFLAIDIEKNEDFVEKYNLEEIPTCLYFKGGKEKSRWLDKDGPVSDWVKFVLTF